MTHDLFAGHQESALRIARAVGARLPRNIEVGDLEQAALIGLHEWCSKHPDSSQPGWRHGLNLRVRGAVIDWVRQEDYLTRGQRQKGELYVGHLEDRRDEDGPGWQDLIGQVDAQFGEHSRLDALAALEALSEREQAIVRNVLFGMLQSDIAKELGVSEPRISQLLTRALQTMRAHLERRRGIVTTPTASVQVLETPKLRVRDFKHELWLARRNALWERMEPGMSMRQLAAKLRKSETTIYYWCTDTKKRIDKFGSMSRRDPISAAVRKRGKELIAAALRAAPTGEGAARLLKITPGGLWPWRKQLLPEVPLCPSGKKRRVDYSKIAALYEGGLSQRQVADALGMKKAGVGHALRRLGFACRRNPPKRMDVTRERCLQLRAEGLSLARIAAQLECGVDLVRRRLREAP